MNIYSCDAFDHAPSRIMHDRSLWSRVAQVHISPTQRHVLLRLCDTPTGSGPALPPELDVNRAGGGGGNRGNTLVVDLASTGGGPSLPLLTSCLVFEYADLHPPSGGAVDAQGHPRRTCSRCRAVLLPGSSTCQVCRQNGNQCLRCLFINMSDDADALLCANCGSSNVNSMDFAIVARSVGVLTLAFGISNPLFIYNGTVGNLRPRLMLDYQ